LPQQAGSHSFVTKTLKIERHFPLPPGARELVDVIFEQPYCRIANLVEAGIAGRQAASRYLKALVAAGALGERAIGKEKLFVHPKLMNLLIRDSNTFTAYRQPSPITRCHK
jgi:Protein adenylyltransferase SoFic-like, C-terminal domain